MADAPPAGNTIPSRKLSTATVAPPTSHIDLDLLGTLYQVTGRFAATRVDRGSRHATVSIRRSSSTKRSIVATDAAWFADDSPGRLM